MAGRKKRRGSKKAPRVNRESLLFSNPVVEGPSWDFGRPYYYRQITAARAQKLYVCPGCSKDIFPGEAHIVAWPRDGGGEGADRRHWHSRCWQAR